MDVGRSAIGDVLTLRISPRLTTVVLRAMQKLGLGASAAAKSSVTAQGELAVGDGDVSRSLFPWRLVFT